MEKVRIGMIGTGFSGDLHADALTRDLRADIVACAGTNQQRAEKFAAKWKIPKAFDDYRARGSRRCGCRCGGARRADSPLAAAGKAAGKHREGAARQGPTQQLAAADDRIHRRAVCWRAPSLRRSWVVGLRGLVIAGQPVPQERPTGAVHLRGAQH